MRGHDVQKVELDLRQLCNELRTLSDEEACRHLMRRLPQNMVHRVSEEEVHINSDPPGRLGRAGGISKCANRRRRR